MRGDKMQSFARPEVRDVGASERMSRSRLGDLYGLLQKKRLFARQTGGDFRIAIRFGIIADPKIEPAVRGEKNRIARDEAIVRPGGCSPECNPGYDRERGKIAPA